MTEQIADLERCWFLSSPWGQNIPPVEVNLLEKVYLKTNRTFGYCCGVQWYSDCWNYVIEVKDDYSNSQFASRNSQVAIRNFCPHKLS
ncbi:DUF1392 family protein [Nostoc sp. ChiQUE01b]|uniref:DUF1392 family protein n=1 Tax=Nostoc sp. ChiQUE01b TaxID=3075376 RepID=UPI002AD4AEEE|nr:DUF1392 family protein [Nostoc sp. ChiQUE01b]MDZ8261960.1 DUF1392 family protein [Nostoc sp. ChiQUE01b]